MNRRTLAIVAAAAGLALTGCTSSPTPPAVGAPAAQAVSAAASPSPTPASPVQTVHRLGQTVTVEAGRGKVTVYGYRQPVATSAPRPDQHGYTWGAIDVKVCVTVEGTVSNEPWTLVYSNGTAAEPSDVGYDAFPLPAYTWDDKDLKAGRCLRGWITYPVPKTRRPAMIEYSVTNDNDAVETYDWKA